MPLLILAAIPVHAAVYRGEAGGRRLIASDDARAYFYEDERLPQPLAPSPDCANGATCYRSAAGDILRLHNNSAWWNDSPLAPFTASPTEADNRLYTAELPFAAALLADITFTQTTSQREQDKTLQWYREPQSGLEHYLMADGYPAAQREALNQYLRAQALNTLAARRECLAALPADKRGALQYRTTITPTLTNDRYLSQHIHEENNCGTPYSGDYGITYSITAGRGLELEDLLWLGDTPPHPLADNNPADQAERERRAQWLLATLKTVAPQMTQDYPYQPHHYLYPYFYLTPQGVYIGPLLPARAAAHAHPAGSVIPYGEIKKHPGILGEKTLP
ncbi:hypothetical protein [Cardiobacterium hominis]|uniref:hypothetical protein n=1 Tax=Cardiobacterium hominis TaxID=2718 RepID=UPI002490C0E1|nr:hypothetical protein [Cardiobacterium hominis]